VWRKARLAGEKGSKEKKGKRKKELWRGEINNPLLVEEEEKETPPCRLLVTSWLESKKKGKEREDDEKEGPKEKKKAPVGSITSFGIVWGKKTVVGGVGGCGFPPPPKNGVLEKREKGEHSRMTKVDFILTSPAGEGGKSNMGGESIPPGAREKGDPICR